MVINKKGGKKGKKGKRPTEQAERKIVLKEELQEYCQITKLLGNCRLEGNCFDGKTRICNIRGSMRKKIWIKVGDIVIVSLREFEDNKCDIIYLYQAKEVKKLVKMGELPDGIKINELDVEDEKVGDIGFDFEESGDEEDEELEKDEFKDKFEEKFDSI